MNRPEVDGADGQAGTAADPLTGTARRVRHRLLDEPVAHTGDLAGWLRALAREEAPLLSEIELDGFVARLVDDVSGLGRLEPLLADPLVSDVLVHGRGEVWIERAGRLERQATVIDEDEVLRFLERALAPLGRRVDRSSPIVDARLASGARLHAVIRPVAVDGPCLAIRRFTARTLPVEVFTARWAPRLVDAVRSRRSILVSGGTGAGKTTLVNALAAHVPDGERVVTIEDAAELRLPIEHVVRLEARPPSPDGAGEVTLRDLVRAALRLRPDRIIVGEVRGPEALDMVQAMNTGHEGSLSTVHANSAADALRRLEVLVLWAGSGLPLIAVREQIAAALDLVVHVARGADGARTVVQVAEVALGPEGWETAAWA